MLDAGGGGGYGGTSWANVTVLDMWLAIGNQETTPHWKLLNGWQKSYELTLQHMSQVKSYRENLATAWPPEKSPASAAYLQRLDDLIAHLQQTYDAAVANHSAFSSATLAISAARADLEKVVNEYVANEGKLATYEKENAEKSEKAKGSKGYGVAPPPVADGRQAELESKARSIMYGLSTEVIQARAQIAKPSKYDPAVMRRKDSNDHGGIQYSPRPIPPVVPFDPGTASSNPSNSSVIGTQSTSPHPAHVPPSPPRQPGLILGGIEPPLVTPSLPTTTNPPIIGASPPPLRPSPRPASSVGPYYRLPTPPASTRNLGGQLPGGATTADGSRAMPPGGVIGGIPGSGLGQPGCR